MMKNISPIILSILYKNVNKIILILLLFSLISFNLGAYFSGYINVKVSDILGLTFHLSPFYYIGLFIVVLCSIYAYLNERNTCTITYLLVLFMLAFFLFGVGVFFQETPRPPSSFYPTSEVLNLLKTNHIQISENYPIISYRSWPGFHFLSANILLISNFSLIILITYMPLIWIFIFLLLTFSIGYALHKNNCKAFLVSFVSLCGFWQIYYYYSPQSIAYLISLLLVYIIIFLKNSHSKVIMSILLFISISITHFLYLIIILTSSVFYFIRKKNFLYIFIFIFLFFSYYIFIANIPLEMGLTKILMNINNFDLGYASQANKFTATTYLKFYADIFRFLFPIILGILFLESLIRNLLLDNNNEHVKSIIIDILIFMIIFCSYVFFDYGSETFERAYMFCLVPIAIIISLSSINKKFFSVIMIILVLIHIPAHYSSESFMVISNAELSGSEFFVKNTNNEHLLSNNEGILAPPLGDRFLSYFNPSLISLYYPYIRTIETSNNLTNIFSKINYFFQGRMYSNYATYYGKENIITKYLESTNNAQINNKIYTTMDTSIYIRG